MKEESGSVVGVTPLTSSHRRDAYDTFRAVLVHLTWQEVAFKVS
jgi:hypothetical protein